MPKLDAFPYLTCGPQLVQADAWHLREKESERVLPGMLRDWDPLADLQLSRSVALDIRAAYDACGLSPDAEIALAASWLSPGSTLKESAALIPLPRATPTGPANISFTVQGSKLSGSIQLLTRLVLRRRGRSDSKLSATLSGSVLWEDEFTTYLEGLGARFPMEFADFSDQGYPSEAGWRLHWSRDFNAQVMGGLCLLINTRHERLRGITSGAVVDAESRAIMETLHFSVARELVIGGLENPEFIEETQRFPRGSIGEAIRMLIRRVFGDEAPESVLRAYKDDRSRFECELQDKLRLFRKPKP